MAAQDQDEDFDTDDALAAGRTIDAEAEEAIASLDRGPGPVETQDALSNIERAAEELVRQAEIVSEAVETLHGGRYGDSIEDLLEGSSDAIDNLRIIRDRACVVEAALQGVEEADDDTSTGTVTLDGTVYEVTFERLHPEIPDTFSEWVVAKQDEIEDATVAWMDRNSLVREERIIEIIEGDDPTGDEGKSLVNAFHDAGYIEDDEREAVFALLDSGSDDSGGEGLGDLFG